MCSSDLRFGVLPSAQGRGVATALVQAAVDASLGHEAVRVVARQELPETVGFWEAAGFVETGRSTPYVELARWLGTSFDAPDAETMRGLGERLGATLVAGDLVVSWPMRHYKAQPAKTVPAKEAYSIRQSTLSIKEIRP